MPNWCSNTLHISGDKEQLKAFKQKAIIRSAMNVDIFLMDNVIPMPAEIMLVEDITEEMKQARIEKYGFFSWYDWRFANWGSRTDANDSNVVDEEDILYIYFDTPWSPAIPFIERIAKLYPDLIFDLYFIETGEWFAGRATAKGDDLQEQFGYPRMVDEWGTEVQWDEEKDMYKYLDKDEWTEDAFEENPFLN